MTRIVIVGAGYAGVLAANRVAGRLGKRAQVTLINDGAELVNRIRLHEAGNAPTPDGVLIGRVQVR